MHQLRHGLAPLLGSIRPTTWLMLKMGWGIDCRAGCYWAGIGDATSVRKAWADGLVTLLAEMRFDFFSMYSIDRG